jgi:hypothetical protein
MFLNWSSQMTALLDKPEAKAVYHIIENMSKDYPQVRKNFIFFLLSKKR